MLKDTLENFANATATRATYATSGMKNDNGVARIARVQVATPKKDIAVVLALNPQAFAADLSLQQLTIKQYLMH